MIYGTGPRAPPSPRYRAPGRDDLPCSSLPGAADDDVAAAPARGTYHRTRLAEGYRTVCATCPPARPRPRYENVASYGAHAPRAVFR